MSFNPERLKVMKKFYIALAVLATAALTSCVQEQSFNGPVIGEDDVAFVLRSGASTKAANSESPTEEGLNLKVGKYGKHALYLEETITDIDAIAPQTKGTPAYTENVGTLYGDQLGVYSTYSGFGEATYEKAGDSMVNGGWSYKHKYEGVSWPEGAVDFYLRMPANAVTTPASGYNNRTVSFSFTSPSKATNQQDLIFAYTSMDQVAHDAKKADGGYPVTFYHALTGVKFRMGNELSDDPAKTRTYINKVEFIGIKNMGNCTIVFPEAGAEDQTPAITWTDGATVSRTTAAAPIYQEYADDDLIDYTGGNKFPESFYGDVVTADGKSGLDKNLNDEDATMTFWLIPQVLDENVEIKVTVKIWDGTQTNGDKEVTLELGTLLSGLEWKAGQLRTYTIKPDVVDVKITDEMVSNSTVKQNVVIKNLGNVKEYVRVNIIANWVGIRQTGIDSHGQPVYEDHQTVLFGFQSAEQDADGNYIDDTEVLAWNDKDPEYRFLNGDVVTATSGTLYTQGGTAYRRYGTFVGLPSLSVSTDPEASWDAPKRWVRFDKFYYYMDPIGPGDHLPSTASLFQSYTVNPSPTYYIADEFGVRRLAKDVHLEMDVLVQAIKVPEDPVTGEELDFISAWKEALAPNNDLDDL